MRSSPPNLIHELNKPCNLGVMLTQSKTSIHNLFTTRLGEGITANQELQYYQEQTQDSRPFHEKKKKEEYMHYKVE